MRRLVVLLAASCVAAAVLVVQAVSAPDQAELERRSIVALLDQADSVWHREDLYLADANLRRMDGVLHGTSLQGAARVTNPGRIRVLVIGDSFTYGSGLTDLDARWWVRLEDELNRRTRDGAFEVVALARAGASTFTQLEWLRALERGERLPASDGTERELALADVDVVVLGYVENDQLPSPTDGLAAVDPSAEYDMIVGRQPNPHWGAFEHAVSEMRDLFGATPVIWLPLGVSTPLTNQYAAVVRPVFAAAGFVVADTAETDEFADRSDTAARLVNPVDTHPGPPLTLRYALDAAAAVLSTVPGERVARATAVAEAAAGNLVSNYLPVQLSVEETTTGAAQVSFDPEGARDQACGQVASGPRRQIVCRGTTPVFLVDDEPVEGQTAPCALLGRPYAQIMFDRTLSDSDRLTVRVVASTLPALELYTYGYDPDGFVQVNEIGTVEIGEHRSFDGGPSARGVLVAPRDGSCDVHRSTVLPKFDLVVSRQPA